MALPAVITAVCRVHFGTRAKKYRDNRCDACPLRAPCLKFGAAPARTLDELNQSRAEFAREATAIVAGKAA